VSERVLRFRQVGADSSQRALSAGGQLYQGDDGASEPGGGLRPLPIEIDGSIVSALRRLLMQFVEYATMSSIPGQSRSILGYFAPDGPDASRRRYDDLEGRLHSGRSPQLCRCRLRERDFILSVVETRPRRGGCHVS
jgi:hypothetical protein